MSCGNFSASTSFLKVAAILLGIAFMLLIVGFSFPRWSTLTVSSDLFGIGFDTDYHVGLWKDCSCTSILGSETCICFGKQALTGWMRAVQAMVTLGLIGLMISAIISIIILFSKQDKTIRGINILAAVCSGVLIVVGVIVFGIENSEDFEDLFYFIDLLYDLDTYGSLSASFYLSTISGALCLLVCAPLLVKDYLTPIKIPAQRVNPVQYTNQGHVMIPPPGQTHVFVNTSVQQPGGYMQTYPQAPAVQTYPQAPPVSLPTGQYVQGQSVYPPPPHQQQYGAQYPQQDSEHLYKS